MPFRDEVEATGSVGSPGTWTLAQDPGWGSPGSPGVPGAVGLVLPEGAAPPVASDTGAALSKVDTLWAVVSGVSAQVFRSQAAAQAGTPVLLLDDAGSGWRLERLSVRERVQRQILRQLADGLGLNEGSVQRADAETPNEPEIVDGVRPEGWLLVTSTDEDGRDRDEGVTQAVHTADAGFTIDAELVRRPEGVGTEQWSNRWIAAIKRVVTRLCDEPENAGDETVITQAWIAGAAVLPAADDLDKAGASVEIVAQYRTAWQDPYTVA